MLAIEVTYARLQKQMVVSILVPDGTTVQMAIEISGILTLFEEIDLTKNKVGIFGKLVSLQTRVKAEDRIEIYRPLRIHPMEARRLRAKNV
jgi:uncharacterized protein